MKSTILIATLIIVALPIYSQKASSGDEHQGFQFTALVGPGFGNTQSTTKDFGKMIYRGGRLSMDLQIGYAYKNWGAGLAIGANQQNFSSVTVHDSTYKTKPGYSISGNLTGIYIKKYFMPINMFVSAEIGVGSISITDETSATQGETDNGLSWNVSVGKEFRLGKKQKWSLGGFAGLSGIKCHDVPPYASDTYKYLAVNFGVAVSYH
ncbi:MAG: hypothetical protein KG003_02250 [Bacteroidetes bacterium]|nr:hypothetical protein [Bacteroidota bacterium]